MFTDEELDDLEDQVSAFEINAAQLQSLTSKYQGIIEDYRKLKSDYEEARESREKYKKQLRERGRIPGTTTKEICGSGKPFVLVLVDGDGYIFKEDLIRKGPEGGADAAQLLQQHVVECLSRFDSVDQCHIVIRIYANLHGISKALARIGQAGHEARSLAPFMSSFTRSQELFDFVDTGDQRNSVHSKIKETFDLFIENKQCKHVFFAGCHDTAYLPLLAPYKNKLDQITLIKSSAFGNGFKMLSLRTEEFTSVFRSTTVEGFSYTTKTSSVSKNTNGISPSTVGEIKKNEPTKNVCIFYQKNNCKYGNGCQNLHLDQGGRDVRDRSIPDIPSSRETNWRRNMSVSSLQEPSGSTTSRSSTPPILSEPLSLPEYRDGFIPINRDGMRIDTALPDPSKAERLAYNARANTRRLCNHYQLTGECTQLSNCPYDHSYLEPELLNVLKHFVRRYPCTKKGLCRNAKCDKGHVCVWSGCQGSKCKLGQQMHNMDLRVIGWANAGAEAGPLESEDGVKLGW